MKTLKLTLLIAFFPAVLMAQEYAFVSYDYSIDKAGQLSYIKEKLISVVINPKSLELELVGEAIQTLAPSFIEENQSADVEIKYVCRNGLTVWVNLHHKVIVIENKKAGETYRLYDVMQIDM